VHFTKAALGAGVAQSVYKPGYSLDDWGSILGRRYGGSVSLRHRIQTGAGAHSASYQVSTGDSFPGVKIRGREADHTPPCFVEFKNVCSYTSTRTKRLRGVVLN
jgi:hypothetical protein